MTRYVALFLCSAGLNAEQIQLDLEIQPNSITTLTYRVGSILTLQPLALPNQDIFGASLSYSGNILASAGIDPSNGEIETIEFVGGQIFTENVTDVQSVTINVTPFLLSFTTQGITRTAISSAVEVLDDSFLDPDLHSTLFTGGIVQTTNSNLSGGPTVTETEDLSVEESDLIGSELLFPSATATETTSIGSVLVEAGLLGNSYQVFFTSLIQIPAVMPDASIQAAGLASNQRFSQRYTEFGFLSAMDDFTILTPFGLWALEQNLELSTGDEVNAAGIPFALIFALGLDLEATSLPVTFESTSPTILAVELPSEGLQLRLMVEYSEDLISEFTTIESSQLLDGANSLNVGSSGTVRIALPEGPRGFIRFVTAP